MGQRWVAGFGGPIVGIADTPEEALDLFVPPAYLVETLAPHEASVYPVWHDVERTPLAGLYVVAAAKVRS